jgi:GNAT superfamily N-acetyltransferase
VETAPLLELFDRQMRRDAADEDGVYLGGEWNAVLWPAGDVDRVLARLRACSGHREWKLYGHDPHGLAERLLAAGLVPEEQETVLVADAASIPPTTTSTEVATDTDAYLDLAAQVFGRRFGLPRDAVAVVALVDGEPVSGGRVDLEPGKDFAGLFGGATLPAFRGRGLYRATVAERARIARDHGHRWLFVDALPTSRPILERLGFEPLTTTTPYVFVPDS